jgi:hypothetical protein
MMIRSILAILALLFLFWISLLAIEDAGYTIFEAQPMLYYSEDALQRAPSMESQRVVMSGGSTMFSDAIAELSIVRNGERVMVGMGQKDGMGNNVNENQEL